MSLLETEDFFDYICPECKNYVMLEKSKYNKNILEGTCALCGETSYILYEDWEEAEKKRLKKGDEEVE